MSKLMMLVAAKWREFSVENPNLLQSENNDQEQPTQSTESEYSNKSNRSRSTMETLKVF